MTQARLLIMKEKKRFLKKAVSRFGMGCTVIFTNGEGSDKLYANITGASIEDICRVCYLAGYFQSSEK